MLTLVITQKRIFASAHQQLLHTINTPTQTSSSHNPTSLAETLSNQLSEIKERYLEHIRTHFGEPPLTIPVSVSIPVDPVGAEEGEKILDLFRNPSRSGFSLVFTDNLAQSFLYGISPENGLVSSASIVLEAMEDHVHLYHHNLPEKDAPFTVVSLPKLGYLPGKIHLFEKVVEQVRKGGIELSETEQCNFRSWLDNGYMGEEISYAFTHQLEKTEIQFQVQVPQESVLEALVYGRQDLEKYLNPAHLAEHQIYKVVLLGEYLQNPVLMKYLSEDLGIGDKIQSGPPLESDLDTLVKGLEYRAHHYLEEKLRRKKALQRKKEAIERKNKVKEARQLTQKLNLEIQQFENRERFFAQMANMVIDPEEESQFVNKLIQEGQELALPESIIKFKIDEVLTRSRIQALKIQSRALEEELQRLETVEDEEDYEDVDDFVDEDSDVSFEDVLGFIEPTISLKEENETEQHEDKPLMEDTEEDGAEEVPQPHTEPLPEMTQPTPVGPSIVKALPTTESSSVPGLSPSTLVPTLVKPEEEPTVKAIAKDTFAPPVEWSENETSSPRIRDIFQVKQFLQTPDFQSMVVSKSQTKKRLLLRLITFQQLEDPMLWESFMAIHRREAAYYSDVSEVRTAKEGLYYLRKAVEGVPLRVHIRKSGLDRKIDIEKFSPQDNLLLLEVIRAIIDLEVAHPNLNEDNILVHVKRTWSLDKSIKVQLSGFTSQPGTKAETIELMNYMFERLLRPGVYNDFRAKHNL